MKFSLSLRLAAAILIAPLMATAADEFGEPFHIGENVCDYFGIDSAEMPDTVHTFRSSQDAEDAIKSIVYSIGLTPNFKVLAAGVPNAVAVVQGEQRLIIYNPEFMNKMRSETGTDWAAVSILAHEIGHHLQGHTLQAGGSRPKIELEADKFSGHVLQKLGASLEQAQIVMKTLGSETGSRTHPAKRDRLVAIASGYEEECERTNSCPNSGDTNRNAPAPSNTTNSTPTGG